MKEVIKAAAQREAVAHLRIVLGIRNRRPGLLSAPIGR